MDWFNTHVESARELFDAAQAVNSTRCIMRATTSYRKGCKRRVRKDVGLENDRDEYPAHFVYDRRVYRPTLPPSRDEQIAFLNDITNGVYTRDKQALVQEFINRTPGQFNTIPSIYPQYNNAAVYRGAVFNWNTNQMVCPTLGGTPNSDGYRDCHIKMLGQSHNQFIHRLVTYATRMGPGLGKCTTHVYIYYTFCVYI